MVGAGKTLVLILHPISILGYISHRAHGIIIITTQTKRMKLKTKTKKCVFLKSFVVVVVLRAALINWNSV